MCFRRTQHPVEGMEKGVCWHQNEEQRDKTERKQVKMKGEKGNENEVWFFEGQKHSVTHNQFSTNTPILVCDGMEEREGMLCRPYD